MVEIYRHAFRYYWSMLPLLLGFAAFMVGLTWFLESKHHGAGRLVGMLLIIYQFHRHYLFEETALHFLKPNADMPPQRFGWFLVISLALLFLPLGIGFGLAFFIAPQGWDTSTTIGLGILTFGLLYLLALSLFGTALPASVARPGNFKMSSGIKVAIGTMWRLLAGPVVVQLLLLGAAIGLDYLMRGVPAYQSTFGQLAVSVIVTTAGFLPSLLGVAVLCHMYQKVMAATPGPEITKADLA